MKLCLILIAGSLPLLAVTISYFLPAAHNEVVTAPGIDNPSAYDELKKATDDAVADLNQEAIAYADRLRQVDLLAANKIPPEHNLAAPTTPTGKKWYSAVFESWERARKTHDGVAQFANSMSAKGARSKQEQLDQWKAFSSEGGADNPLSGVLGSAGFMQFVDTQIESIKPQIEAEKTFKKASDLLAQKNYTACLTEIRTIIRANQPSDLLTKIQELERQASFWKHWQDEPVATDISKSSLDKRKSLRRTSPPAVLADEKVKLELIDQEIARSNCDQDRDQLRTSPPERARDYLQKVGVLIKNCPDAQRALRSQFEQWIASKLPLRSSPESVKLLSEAERTNGKLALGVFRPAGGFYKYWSTSGEFQKRGENNYETEMYLDRNLKAAPRDTFYVRAVNEFNEGRRKLLAHKQAESEWRDFAAICQRLEGEYKRYKERGGLIEIERATGGAVADLNFEEASTFASEVLSEWDAANSLLGE